MQFLLFFTILKPQSPTVEFKLEIYLYKRHNFLFEMFSNFIPPWSLTLLCLPAACSMMSFSTITSILGVVRVGQKKGN